MAIEKVSFGNYIFFALALTEVTAWTIDLPEVRKYLYEKNTREEKYEDYKYKNDEERQVYYSNVEGNSKHNSKHHEDLYENTAYAREYGYQSYMEKKVNGVVKNGSVYLEGLRRSLENYTQFLESCNRGNFRNGSSFQSNVTTPAIEPSSFNSTNTNNSTNSERNANNTTNFDRNTNNSTNNLTNLQRNANNSSNSERCREATQASEHVRRLSELAMWATRELQDIAYARKYKKGDYHDLTQEENELILKLAWFLDRLAYYTGYEPEPRDFLERGGYRSSSSTTTPAPFSLVSPPAEVKRAMMECLQGNPSQAAVDRCRYPEPLPPAVLTLIEMNSNSSGTAAIPTSSSSNRNEQVVPLPSASPSDPNSEQSLELLIATDYRTPTANTRHITSPHTNYPPILTAIRNVHKRSISSMPEPEVIDAPIIKRFNGDDPVINFFKYYAKHKVWDGSNLKNVGTKSTFEVYEVQNQISPHIIKKRAVAKKSKHLRLPENPFQDLSKYIKHKPGVNYIKDEVQAEKIRTALEKMRINKASSKNVLRTITKILRPKRSKYYEKDVDLPRDSVNPQKDLSFYVKNKPGRNYESNLVQAAQVRAGLEQIFNTGNIEVVRRFGANYNPLVPAPFFAGIAKSMADF